jgi:hypothetical protein
VDKEHDRQRVLIQITQNLATRIRNSHAFNLPTFYLPTDANQDSNIPNAIQEVCQEIDKVGFFLGGGLLPGRQPRHVAQRCRASQLRAGAGYCRPAPAEPLAPTPPTPTHHHHHHHVFPRAQAINMTVQKVLKVLKQDCTAIEERIDKVGGRRACLAGAG